MEDRELLELAAKAAGYVVSFADEMSMDCVNGTYYTHDRGYPSANREGSNWWNPLLDDGDALRLAVELRLVVHVWDDGSGVSAAKTAPDGDDPSDDSGAWCWATSNGDTSAAARYAIVGAAAKIGSAMP